MFSLEYGADFGVREKQNGVKWSSQRRLQSWPIQTYIVTFQQPHRLLNFMTFSISSNDYVRNFNEFLR